MDKEKLLKALNSIQQGKHAGLYHYEIETLITLVVNAKDEDINDAWEDYHTDTEQNIFCVQLFHSRFYFIMRAANILRH